MGKKSFHFLWLGQALANMGDVFYIVALIALLYELSGSVTVMALLPLFNTTSRLLGSLSVPLLFHRFQLTHILAYSQLGKTILLLGLAVFSVAFLNSAILWFVFLFIITIAFLDGWANPAKDALLPRIVPAGELVKANNFVASVDQIIQLSSWAFGGVIVAFIGAEQAIWLTLGLYCFAALMMFLLCQLQQDSSPVHSEMSTIDSRFTAGWRAVWNRTDLRLISFNDILESSANVVWIAAIMYVFVVNVLQAGEQWWGYINASLSIGLLLGGFLGYRYAHVIEKYLQKNMILGAFLMMSATIIFAINANPWGALIISALYGFFSQVKGVATQTYVQVNVPETLLPKVYAAQETIFLASFAISTLLYGFLTDVFGARFIFLFAAGLLFISATVLLTFHKQLHMNSEQKV